jgi:NADH-quinone oxidoreductase subunit M
MLVFNLLSFLFFSTVLGLFLPQTNLYSLRIFSLVVFCVSFLYSILIVFLTNPYLFLYEVVSFEAITPVNFYYFLGVDSISVLFILLTSLLFVLCTLSSFTNVWFSYKSFIIVMLLLDFFLISLFSTLDLFFFYIFFESILVPMFLLIGIWGSRQRRIHAGLQFFFYTLFGSFFMLVGLVVLYSHVFTTNVMMLNISSISNERQLIIWFCFFIAFAVKIPMFPFHI